MNRCISPTLDPIHDANVKFKDKLSDVHEHKHH